ncbi:MAG: hypothetical protein DPW22_00580 [Alphaproteobacteria bacterium]|nr:hypothetical protein [Alphaproteobacteria bacterium]
MRALSAVLSALLLGACATGDAVVATPPAPAEKPDYGRWAVEPRTEPLTGAPIATAYIKIDRLDFITGRVNSAVLQLMCFRRAPVVRIAFNVKVGSNRSAELTYRFDDRPGRAPAARFLPDFRTIVIEKESDVATFIDELVRAQQMHLEIGSLIVGRTTLKLAVHSAPAAVEAAYASCPLPPAAMRPPTT